MHRGVLHGPGPRRPGPGSQGVGGPGALLLISGTAIPQKLQSSHAIDERPCADLVMYFWGGCTFINVYLDLA